MSFIRKSWLPLLGASALVALVYLVANWGDLSTTQRLSFVVAIVLVLHINEEEWAPGGFGYFFNVLRYNSDTPDRYPMNPLIAMIVDVTMFFILFVPPLLTDVVWLGMAPMFLALLEGLAHGLMGGFILQRKGKGWPMYNPGLLTAVVLTGIGVAYIVVVVSDGLMSGLDWLWAVLFFVGTMVVGLVLPEQGLKSKTTSDEWAFTPDEMLGYYKRYTTYEEVMADVAAAGRSGD